MKKLSILFLFLGIGLFVNAQKYEIKVNIKGVNDTVIYLGNHFGTKKYVVDTARIDSNGNAVFKGDTDLERGIYLIVMPSLNMNYFELLIADSRFLSIEADTADFIGNIKVKGSAENIVFNEYQKEMKDYQLKRMALDKEYGEAKAANEDTKEITDKIIAMNVDREKYMKDLIAKNPDYFFSKILNSMIDVEVPESPKDAEGNVIDPTFQYVFTKKHFFDNIDFSERGLLRTPIFEGKIDYYLAKMVAPLPDSLIKETKYLISKAYDAGDSLVYQYTLSHLFNNYDTSRIMGYDAIFVAIAEDWYLSGKAPWVDTSLLKKISERVEKITPNKIGNIAPNLERMQGIDDKYYSLHNIPGDYTVLVFFEPSCGHCKKEVPKLMQQFRDSLKNMNITVFAIYTQYDKEEWKKFIDEKNLREDGWYNVWDGPYPHSRFRDFYDIYSTPVIFVLDKDKRIVGKRLGVEDIKGFIEFEKARKEFENTRK